MRFSILVVLSLITVMACNPSQAQQSEGQKKSDVQKIETYITDNNLEDLSRATFAGGCFWCTEASFERIRGVVDVVSGYSGGEKPYPTYREVASGQTMYAESIEVFYNSDEITYQKLLEIFFTAHDPTQLNRQGPDIGPQYRSAIFYKTEEQLRQAENYIDKLTRENVFAKPVVTELTPYENFYVAEKYHQNYYVNNPNNRYIQNVSRPKVEKVEKKFADLLKASYK